MSNSKPTTTAEVVSGFVKSRVKIDVVDTEIPQHPSSQSLLDFWKSRQTADGLIPRSAIPCREISAFMPDLFLLEPVDGAGIDWRFRFAGSGFYARYGGDLKGRLISKVYAQDRLEASALFYRGVAFGRKPRVVRGRFYGIDREFYHLEMTHVPAEGVAPGLEMVLGGVFVLSQGQAPTGVSSAKTQ